jgi:hypothetical protein
MPTTRQYTFDIDTKRYLNRVNTYRSLSGFNPITNSEAADIDNFVIGLKDLGLWNAMVCWLLRSQHNIGAGTTVLSLGSLGGSNSNGIMVNSPTWSLSGITFGGTVANSARINLPIGLKDQISYSGSIFGCVNYQAGVIEDNNFAIFLWADSDGDPTFPSIMVNQQTSQGVVPVVTRNSTRYFQTTRGGAFSTGFSTVAGNFEINAQSNYRNGVLIGRESNLGTINPASRPIAAGGCFIGRGNYVTGGVTVSISLVTAKILTNSEMTSLHNLYKATVGKGLGLP